MRSLSDTCRPHGREANMSAVYAMQPESPEFREALGCVPLREPLLRSALEELWRDDEAWRLGQATEALEWLLRHGAPASLLLPQKPESLRTRLRALRLLRAAVKSLPFSQGLVSR